MKDWKSKCVHEDHRIEVTVPLLEMSDQNFLSNEQSIFDKFEKLCRIASFVVTVKRDIKTRLNGILHEERKKREQAEKEKEKAEKDREKAEEYSKMIEEKLKGEQLKFQADLARIREEMEKKREETESECV